MNIFDKIKERVQEPSTRLCPFCNCGYIHRTEVRILNKCPICKGRGDLAEDADEAVDAILTDLNKYSDDEILQFIMKLGAGFHRMELRTYLNKRKTE